MEFDDETIGFQAQPMEEDPEPQTKRAKHSDFSIFSTGNFQIFCLFLVLVISRFFFYFKIQNHKQNS
jgi:hypothetical protein